MRLLKALTLMLAVAGTIALVLAARTTARPLTPISAMQPVMNFAYVRIAGAVIAYPSLASDDSYLSFRVQDSSGEIQVSAYRSTVEALLSNHRIPMPGDQVTVEGTLRIREDEPTLTLNMPEALTIDTTVAHRLDMSALDTLDLGERATVSGQVRRVRDASSVLRIVTLRNGATQADVLLPLDLVEVFGPMPRLQPGDWISVTGGVDEYRGARQLLPAMARDVVALPEALALDYRPISALSRKMVGQWVAVRGAVDQLRPISGGMQIDVRDQDDAVITVVLFEQWLSVPFSQTLRSGDVVSAQGELAEYHGKLEVQPELSIDVSTIGSK